MASAQKTDAPGNRLFVLALGLLVGFVIAFVMLLSRLPVDSSLNDYSAAELFPDITGGNGYQFYSKLQEQTVAQTPSDTTAQQLAGVEVSPPTIIVPATRVVPGSAQRLNGRSLASEGYAEIPASSLGQESYYLQAGNFRQPEDAERTRAAVLLLGLDPFIVVRQDSTGATGHRVRIGPFFDEPKINEAQKRLNRGGFQTKLIRVTG